MPILVINNNNNDNKNIKRAFAKMSDNFSTTIKNNVKLTTSAKSQQQYLEQRNNSTSVSDSSSNLISYDHMYASNNVTVNNSGGSSDDSCQAVQSEVRLLKEWLILHLDLIQQQNDEILDKDKAILNLKRENEMLKERINSLEKGTPLQLNNSTANRKEDTHRNTLNRTSNNDIISTNEGEDSAQQHCTNMILDSHCEDTKDNLQLLIHDNCVDGDEKPNQNNCISVNDIDLIPIKTEEIEINEANFLDDTLNSTGDGGGGGGGSINFQLHSNQTVHSSPVLNNSTPLSDFKFSINNSSDFDPMRNLRMNIRRKRLCSNSSALSNNDSSTNEEKAVSFQKKFKKKRKRLPKDAQILSTPLEYITQAGECHLVGGTSHDNQPDIPSNTTLEVPRWRIKLYGSCYTMEGTENLDDEVYNKRHSRLENDERRRKRWDVQRIREQRVIEKLKQRQERVGSGSRTDEQNEIVQSLWPKIEDVKLLEVNDELPVSAFGCPVPKTTVCEFNLPWLDNPSILASKVYTKKAVRRKNTKR